MKTAQASLRARAVFLLSQRFPPVALHPCGIPRQGSHRRCRYPQPRPAPCRCPHRPQRRHEAGGASVQAGSHQANILPGACKMRKDLSPAIDAPRLSCYSKCDAAPLLHTGCVSHFSSPPAAECYPPLHSRREASFCFARKRPLRRFFTCQTYPPVKAESPL